MLKKASHVLVVGHSLRDPPLVSRLISAAQRSDLSVGVLVLSRRKGQGRHFETLDASLHKLVEKNLPQATMIRGSFEAPEPKIALADIRKWLSYRRSPS